MEDTTPKPTGNRTYAIIALIIIILLLLGGLAYYFGKDQPAPVDEKALAAQQNAAVLAAVGKLMVLPSDPKMVVATISDITKLKGQKFFATAQNGDNLIIIPSESKVVLYRASINKILDVGPYATAPATTTAASKR